MRFILLRFALSLVFHLPIVAFLSTVVLIKVEAQETQTPKPITLEDIWQKGTFTSKGIPGFNFQNDGVHFTRLEGSRIIQFDLRSGQCTDTIFDPATLYPNRVWTFDSYLFSADESRILLTSNSTPIFRRSSEADYFVFDRKTNRLAALGNGKERYATFSPDGAIVAYVAGNNLCYKYLVFGEPKRLPGDGPAVIIAENGVIFNATLDGKQNEVINGASDWVYEEEFILVRAFQWSPDGKYLAYLRFDEREVPEMTLDMFNGGTYPESVIYKYPKVGEKNSVVTAHIYELASEKTVEVQIPDREEKDGRLDDYLPRLVWIPSGKLCLTWMNRHQSLQRLLLAEPSTGACAVLQEEKSKYYLDLHDVVFLSDGSGFVMQSEKSGFNHLYKYDMKGKQVAALTKGNFDVTAFYGIDEKNGKVYFQAASKSPMARELFETNLKGSKAKKIKKPAGTNGAQWSSTFDYFVHDFSTANTPPQYSVCDRKGRVLRDLELNNELQSKQTDYGTIPLEFFNFKSSENVPLNGWMIKPTAPAFQNQKLPVLLYVYGGPGSQQVTDAWKGANYWWFQMLAQQGYVVACVDNRGTGARGEEFKKMTYKQLGHYEVLDQIEAAKYLGTLDFVDAARIGIYGGSYGGYMSTNCILKGNDIFKAAIAVAPVTNWKWYDSVYTERYMQTHEENLEGYEENSPTNFAEKLEGNYLLVHGLADDNVHFQNTAELANELIAKNKQFDTMIYPNRKHSIRGDNAQLHLFTLMTKFLNEKLKAKKGEKVAKP